MMHALIAHSEKGRHRREWARAGFALALALLTHVGFVLALHLSAHLGSSTPRSSRGNAKAVVLKALTAEQWRTNRGVADRQRETRSQAALPTPPPTEHKPPEAMPKGQVVDVAPGNQQEAPQANFLAEHNNKVERETRAKVQTPFYRNAMPRATASQPTDGSGTDAAERAQRRGNAGVGADDRPLRTAQPKRALELPDVRRRQEIALKAPSAAGPGVTIQNRSESLEVKGNGTQLRIQPEGPDEGDEASAGRAGEPGALTLLPSAAVLDKIAGAAPNDHLRDVPEGEGTYLNTREWRYASFFNRVKRSVGQQWTPQDQLRLRDPTGNIYGGRDRYTVLAVTLDGTGQLKEAFVERSSGVDFLDLEAVKAFERAQPFPNPPPGLLTTDAKIHFQFGFLLEMSGRPGFRLFRSAE